jgi:hypothetical protein
MRDYARGLLPFLQASSSQPYTGSGDDNISAGNTGAADRGPNSTADLARWLQMAAGYQTPVALTRSSATDTRDAGQPHPTLPRQPNEAYRFGDGKVDQQQTQWPGDTAAGSQPATAFPKGDVRLTAAGDLPCDGFSSGCHNRGTYGTTAMYSISGRKLCFNCAVKYWGIEDLSGEDKIIYLLPYLMGGK